MGRLKSKVLSKKEKQIWLKKKKKKKKSVVPCMAAKFENALPLMAIATVLKASC